ncbi:hypothetical protein QYE76_060464 [Lolium multiflorum]|uniref:Integrase catalytic domain-containing protein n=1 Tax=Lolium multiflorum TaxID=4521 RepID=A0AAD8RZ46_LOLMU|nr:hypothetical protein QYE76_060464 [Lolium multiflorum]
MTQILRLLLEDRQRSRQESEANLAALRQIAQAAAGNRNHEEGEGHGEEAPRSRLRDFQNTNPPVFSKCTAPLDADDWLRTIENNLEVAAVGEQEKVLLATHFLSGPARAWWENVKAMQAEDHVITWEEFTTKFRKAHIPTGLIKMKRDEFFNLKQNNSSVVDYLDKFNTLARYAPQDTDTDEKKRDRFMNGLHEEIQSILVAVPYADLEALVDAAIMVESKRKAAYENRKRKMLQQQQVDLATPSTAVRLHQGLPTHLRGPQHPPLSTAPTIKTPTVQLHSTVPEEEVTTTTPAPIPQLVLLEMVVSLVGSLGTFLPLVKKQANAARGHLNHVNAEEAEEAPDIVMDRPPNGDTDDKPTPPVLPLTSREEEQTPLDAADARTRRTPTPPTRLHRATPPPAAELNASKEELEVAHASLTRDLDHLERANKLVKDELKKLGEDHDLLQETYSKALESMNDPIIDKDVASSSTTFTSEHAKLVEEHVRLQEELSLHVETNTYLESLVTKYGLNYYPNESACEQATTLEENVRLKKELAKFTTTKSKMGLDDLLSKQRSNNQKYGLGYVPKPYKKNNYKKEKPAQEKNKKGYSSGGPKWVFDSGCTNHMTGGRGVLDQFIEDINKKSSITFGDNSKGKVLGYGKVAISKDLCLETVMLVEHLGYNLLSIYHLADAGYNSYFTKYYVQVFRSDNLKLVLVGYVENNLYVVDLSKESPSPSTCLMAAKHDEGWLWHRRLGHVNMRNLKQLLKGEHIVGLTGISFEKDRVCSACVAGKQLKKKHPIKSIVTTSRLWRLHLDLFGPSHYDTLGGSKYGLVIVDDYSRYSWVFLLKSKDETHREFITFAKKAQRTYESEIKAIRTDNGTEFKNYTMQEFVDDEGIKHEFSAPYTPQQNGVVERKNRTIIEMARTMLSEFNSPHNFWGEAISTAVHYSNRLFLRPLHNKTPYELLTGNKPNVMYIRVFGCKCLVKNNKGKLGKFENRTIEGIFVGYAENSHAYRYYNRSTRTIEVSCDVVFLEDNGSQVEQVVPCVAGNDDDPSSAIKHMGIGHIRPMEVHSDDQGDGIEMSHIPKNKKKALNPLSKTMMMIKKHPQLMFKLKLSLMIKY